MTEHEGADEKRTPRRTPRQHPTIDEVFEGYEGGDYEPPTDYPCRGAEIDWGERGETSACPDALPPKSSVSPLESPACAGLSSSSARPLRSMPRRGRAPAPTKGAAPATNAGERSALFGEGALAPTHAAL